MIAADQALFRGLGHYYEGLSILTDAERGESHRLPAYKSALPHFKRALEEFEAARGHEKKLIAQAQSLHNNLFLRWHEVLNSDTERLRAATGTLVNDLAAARSPAVICEQLNRILTEM